MYFADKDYTMIRLLIHLILAVCLFAAGALTCWTVFSNRCDVVRIKGLDLMARSPDELRRVGGVMVKVADTVQYGDPSHTKLEE